MNWQEIFVYLIIFAAALYVGQRIFHRLRGFGGSSKSSCGTSCGKCSSSSVKN